MLGAGTDFAEHYAKDYARWGVSDVVGLETPITVRLKGLGDLPPNAEPFQLSFAASPLLPKRRVLSVADG